MTRNTKGQAETVRLSVRDWIGILSAVLTILVSVFTATLTLERRLTEVLTRQEQLQIRIERLEEQTDRRTYQ